MSELKRRAFMKSSRLLAVSMLAGPAFADDAQAGAEDGPPSVLDAIMTRRSVRHYTSSPVPDEHIRQILEAARMAPTSGNQQPWKFVVTEDPATITKLKEACLAYSIEGFKRRKNPTEIQLKERLAGTTQYYDRCFSAPVYVTVLTDNESKYPSYNHWDGPLAAANLMVAARALGYGTVHYTDSVPSAVTKEVLNIPDRYERVCFTPIGVPVEWPDAPAKKPYASFIVHNSF